MRQPLLYALPKTLPNSHSSLNAEAHACNRHPANQTEQYGLYARFNQLYYICIQTYCRHGYGYHKLSRFGKSLGKSRGKCFFEHYGEKPGIYNGGNEEKYNEPRKHFNEAESATAFRLSVFHKL